MAVIDDEPREVLYLSQSGLSFECRVVGGKLSAELSVNLAQIDNALLASRYPVLLASKYATERTLGRTEKKRALRRLEPRTLDARRPQGLWLSRCGAGKFASRQKASEPMLRVLLSDAESNGGIVCLERFKVRVQP